VRLTYRAGGDDEARDYQVIGFEMGGPEGKSVGSPEAKPSQPAKELALRISDVVAAFNGRRLFQSGRRAVDTAMRRRALVLVRGASPPCAASRAARA
jgi:hypothetical protein